MSQQTTDLENFVFSLMQFGKYDNKSNFEKARLAFLKFSKSFDFRYTDNDVNAALSRALERMSDIAYLDTVEVEPDSVPLDDSKPIDPSHFDTEI